VSNFPIRAATLGFIAAISRSVLAIATVGLIDAGIIPDISSSQEDVSNAILLEADPLKPRIVGLNSASIAVLGYGAGLI
jgi:hypothetical protein